MVAHLVLLRLHQVCRRRWPVIRLFLYAVAMLLGAFLAYRELRFVTIGQTTAEQRRRAFGVRDERERFPEEAA